MPDIIRSEKIVDSGKFSLPVLKIKEYFINSIGINHFIKEKNNEKSQRFLQKRPKSLFQLW